MNSNRSQMDSFEETKNTATEWGLVLLLRLLANLI